MSTVAVLGPGAVGGVLAVGLVNAGVRVVCIARPDTAAVVASEGLTLKRGEGVETARPEATTELEEPVDLLLVTVKAPALDDALGRVAAPVETVVPLLNGIEHMQTIRDRLPGSAVVGATIGRIEAYLERPGTVVQPTPGVVMTVAARCRGRDRRGPGPIGDRRPRERERGGGALGEARAAGARRRGDDAHPASDRRAAQRSGLERAAAAGDRGDAARSPPATA